MKAKATLVVIAALTLLMLLNLMLLNPSTRTAALTQTTFIQISTVDPRGPQIQVPVGTKVTVYIKISGPPNTYGTLKVEVRKDIVYSTDQVKTTLSKSVTIPSSGVTDWVNMGTFVADELTTGAPFQLREYFIKVWWDTTLIYDPTDPNTREWVKTYSPTVVYQGGEFEG